MASSFQGANREFSQEMPKLVKAILDLIGGAGMDAHLDDVAGNDTMTVDAFCSWYGIDEDTLMGIVRGEYAVLTFNDLTSWTLIGSDAVQDDEDPEIILKYNVKFTCEGQLYEVSLDVENQTVTTSIQEYFVASEDINKVVVLTESEYEALSVKNSKTEYNIIPD